MKKSSIIAIVMISALVVIFVALGIYKFKFTNSKSLFALNDKIEFKNATYIIEGQALTLRNGNFESEIATDSASKIVTRYFGNEAFGDLNGDGQADVAFLLTQNGGGSGTFYYVAVALAGAKGYAGLNAIFLGDRIAPQTTEIRDGQIIVNFAVQKNDEPLTAIPSLAVSKYFQVVDNQLVSVEPIK